MAAPPWQTIITLHRIRKLNPLHSLFLSKSCIDRFVSCQVQSHLLSLSDVTFLHSLLLSLILSTATIVELNYDSIEHTIEMSYYRHSNDPGNLHPGFAGQNNDEFDTIEQHPRNPFESPYMSPRRSLSPESDKGDSSDTSRHYSDASISRSESYGFPQVPTTTRPQHVLLGRAPGNRSSDIYDESPPRTPTSHPPRRPWLATSRPSSEATLMGTSMSPTPYSVSPYVCVQMLGVYKDIH